MIGFLQMHSHGSGGVSVLEFKNFLSGGKSGNEADAGLRNLEIFGKRLRNRPVRPPLPRRLSHHNYEIRLACPSEGGSIFSTFSSFAPGFAFTKIFIGTAKKPNSTFSHSAECENVRKFA